MEQKIKRKRNTGDKKRMEEMNRQLTEELFCIAMGRDNSTGEPVAIKDRLKAIELMTALKKGGENSSAFLLLG